MLSALPQPILGFSLLSQGKNCKFKFPRLLLSLLPLFLSLPVHAQTNNLLLSQMLPPSNEQLPSLPMSNQGYIAPRVNNGVGQSYDFQAPPQNQNTQYNQTQIYQYQNNQTAERFSVLVDAANYNFQLLPVVKQIEPSAYIRNFGGRSVIQAGIFSRQQNAIARIQQLLGTGINFNNIRLFNQTRGQEIAITPAGGGGNVVNGEGIGGEQQNRSDNYYVAIPASSDEFPAIEERIQRSLGQFLNNVAVQRRNNPRGTHIAVGPFAQRSEAEQWNAALKNAGLGNARVYYGR